MIPPTLQEVEQYVKDNGFHVDPLEFIKYYEDADPPWTYYDRSGKLKYLKNWKQKLRMVWEKIARKQPHKCYCGKIGVYYAGTDIQGFPYYYCIDHKPVRKRQLPEEILNQAKLKKVPSPEVNVNNERNRQLDKLEGRA